MTKKEADFIGSMNMCDEISNEAYKKIMCNCEDEESQQTRWIPISERLPEIHQNILLSLRSLDVEVGFRAETEPYFYCHGDYIEPQNVLAWMPLPKPYKAESEAREWL